MDLTTFCDIHSVTNRDRSVASRLFGRQDATESTWATLFAKKRLSFKGEVALISSSQVQQLLRKTLEELASLAAQYPEDEWGHFKKNKGQMVKYLSTK